MLENLSEGQLVINCRIDRQTELKIDDRYEEKESGGAMSLFCTF